MRRLEEMAIAILVDFVLHAPLHTPLHSRDSDVLVTFLVLFYREDFILGRLEGNMLHENVVLKEMLLTKCCNKSIICVHSIMPVQIHPFELELVCIIMANAITTMWSVLFVACRLACVHRKLLMNDFFHVSDLGISGAHLCGDTAE